MLQLIAPGLLVTLLVAWGCWLWAARLDRRPTVRLLIALVGSSAVIVVTQLALGGVGWLTPGGLLAVSLIVALTLIVSFFTVGARAFDDVSSVCNPFRVRRPTVVGLVLGVITVVVYGCLAVVGTLVPPYGWDTLTYHLTNVFHFAQTGGLSVFPYPGYVYYYSQAGELHSLWFYLLAGGGPEAWRVTGLGLAPFALTLGVAGRALAEALGLRFGRHWIVPAVMLAPVVVIHPLSGYVDVLFAGLLAAAVAFAALAAQEGRFRFLVMAALASGLALGVKGSFLYYGVMVVVVAASLRVWRRLARGRPALAVARVLVLLVALGLGCSFWYGRNLVRTGNPLYPIGVRVAGISLLHGPVGLPSPGYRQELYVPSTLQWLRYPFYETLRGKPDYTSDTGFGPQLAIGWVALLIMLPVAFVRRRWTLFRTLLAVPIWWLMLIFLSPVLQLRYIIAVIPLVIVALVALADLSVHAGDGELSPDEVSERWRSAPVSEEDLFRLSPSRATTEPASTSAGRSAPPGHRAPEVAFDILVVAACLFAAVGGVVNLTPDFETVAARWHAGGWKPTDYYVVLYGPAGAAFNWLSDASHEPKTVTFTNATFVAPLYGWHNRNRVVYAATPDRVPVGSAPRVASYQEWLEFLAKEQVDWVVVWIPWWGEQSNDIARDWINAHPGDFELLRDFGGRCQVFRPLVDSAALAARASVPVAEDVKHLDNAGAWVQEYETGTRLTFGEAPEGGVRFSYTFTGPGNDYADLRGIVERGDWRSFRFLHFDVDAEPQQTLLFVYLKDKDPHQACRFRIDLDSWANDRPGVALDLSRPDWRTPDFDLGDVHQVHLVIDDAEDAVTGSASLRLSHFRLSRDDEPEATPTDTAANEEGPSQ